MPHENSATLTDSTLPGEYNASQAGVSSYSQITMLCEFCVVFAADYTNEYHPWLNSINSNDQIALDPRHPRFSIPYHRKDTLPNFPNISQTAGAGCRFCIAIKERLHARNYVQSEIELTGGFVFERIPTDFVLQAFRIRIHISGVTTREHENIDFRVFSTGRGIYIFLC